MMQERGRRPTSMYCVLKHSAPHCTGCCALLQEQKIVVTQPVAMLQEAPKWKDGPELSEPSELVVSEKPPSHEVPSC